MQIVSQVKNQSANTFNSFPFAIPQSGTMDIQLGVDVVDMPFYRTRRYKKLVLNVTSEINNVIAKHDGGPEAFAFSKGEKGWG